MRASRDDASTLAAGRIAGPAPGRASATSPDPAPAPTPPARRIGTTQTTAPDQAAKPIVPQRKLRRDFRGTSRCVSKPGGFRIGVGTAERGSCGSATRQAGAVDADSYRRVTPRGTRERRHTLHSDRLEQQGWVARQPNPADRRSSALTLTDDGARLVEAAEQTFARKLAELFGNSVSDSSLSVVAQAFSRLRSALERDRIGLPAG
ncbi:MarR family transcriptional regulator [Nocardia brasiliensis]|uniref:MarR family transcriptional regulator n=1 Tax=Nocardia brasiliensis TaxID=37326 RepID=UPI001894A572|nr:MarR family transcriptional regulator [Nocardia brasiliensis]MBF6127541.1 MarR family transcriptional regulator [Nocardia brasiliensis]